MGGLHLVCHIAAHCTPNLYLSDTNPETSWVFGVSEAVEQCVSPSEAAAQMHTLFLPLLLPLKL